MDGILLNEAKVFLFFNYLKTKVVGICFLRHDILQNAL